MTMGEKLKESRISLNISQSELAEKVGITERSIYNYEQSETYPKPLVLKKLAQVLNVTVAYLMDDTETDKQKDIEHELFMANAKKEYGYKGAKEAKEVLSRVSALLAGGELNEEAKDVFFRSLMEVYLESKAEAKEKFSRKRAGRKGQMI